MTVPPVIPFDAPPSSHVDEAPVPSSYDLSDPYAVMASLARIGRDLAERQNELEDAAFEWFKAKRDKEHDRAVEFLRAVGSVAERNAIADREVATDGSDAEAKYESLKAVVRVLETRSNIGMAILKAQSRT